MSCINRYMICETAMFVGKDGSMGFAHGKVYTITVHVENGRVYVIDHDNRKWIPYDTMSALVKNWDFEKPYKSDVLKRIKAGKGIERLNKSDTVPVVHCKDCKYWDGSSCYVMTKGTIVQSCNENWFCADGERKDDETDG